MASAILNTSRQVGGAVGIALLGAVFSSRFRAALPPGVGDAASGVLAVTLLGALRRQGPVATGGRTASGATSGTGARTE